MESLLSLKTVYITTGASFLLIVGYFWFFRIRRTINGYLELVGNIIDCEQAKKIRLRIDGWLRSMPGAHKDGLRGVVI